ncbi:hypothetical protein ACFQUU_21310 [Herbaspirillum sp. GCM10030257]|uniref:hypothetical protein n=1 Tax=Herbaspirillum sp. GCM10030257 TaxID=3273393 RepID=UPI00361E3C23
MDRVKDHRKTTGHVICIKALLLLTACGGGGSSPSDTTQAEAASHVAEASPTDLDTSPAQSPVNPSTLSALSPPPAPSPSRPELDATVLSVGPGKAYATPCAAFAAAGDGSIIEIDAAGSYVGDVCGITRNNLTIRGINGRPKIDANGKNAMGKGSWVVSGSNTTIENIEMYGARVPDKNGAAIRLDGKHLTLRGSYLHDNENGILTNNDGVSNVVIEYTEFANNGYGDGYSHNLYVGHVASLVFRFNYSHDAKVGHNLKSRAAVNTIAYNRFSSDGSGSPSYEIDLPDAGTAYVIGNVIQQPSNNQNPSLLSFGAESTSNDEQKLYVVNNTFLNDNATQGTFINIGSGVTRPALIQNNVFAGVGRVTTHSSAVLRTNYNAVSAPFTNRSSYDLRPQTGLALHNSGSTLELTDTGVSLAPVFQYRHPTSKEARPAAGLIDIGAYELP